MRVRKIRLVHLSWYHSYARKEQVRLYAQSEVRHAKRLGASEDSLAAPRHGADISQLLQRYDYICLSSRMPSLSASRNIPYLSDPRKVPGGTVILPSPD